MARGKQCGDGEHRGQRVGDNMQIGSAQIGIIVMRMMMVVMIVRMIIMAVMVSLQQEGACDIDQQSYNRDSDRFIE